MDLTVSIVLILHLFGVAMGAGGAIATDATFLRSIWNRNISKDQLDLLENLSRVVISGLVILVATGATLVFLNPHYLSLDGESAVFWTKMSIVALLSLNGFAFHKKVLPLLKKYADKDLNTSEIKKNVWLLALTGGLSGISWYSAVALGVLMQVINLPYFLLMNIYLLLVIGAVLSAYVMLYFIVFRKQQGESEVEAIKSIIGTEAQEISHNKQAQHLFKVVTAKPSIVVGTILVFAVGAFGIWASDATETQATDHYVCIQEAPPWFSPDVVEIEKGDTVIWHHCAEGETGGSTPTSLFNSKVSAHSDPGHDNGASAHIHTHPIMSISGPEEFSSDFATVGHIDDGLEFRHTFTEEGVYEYICPTHPYMKGIVAVGEEAPVDSLWPPDEGVSEDELLSAPDIPGIGEIWVNTQFEAIDGQNFPGSITVLDAATWQTRNVITHETFNNPHNLWNTYDNRYIFQTQWHSDTVSKIDIQTKEVVGTIELGNAPAHLFVHPHEDKIYVTINNEDKVVVINSDLEILNEIQTSFGPHGIWIDPSGKWMSVAATLEQKLDIIDLETEEVVRTFDAPGLPLATQITHDGKYAMISLLLEGKVMFIDLDTMEHVKDVEVGSMPIWAKPGPQGEYVFVPNTGSGDVSVISLDTLEVVKTLPAAAGAHGIAFGEREDGGYYGYVSNKYARVVSVIDYDQLETLGHIRLHDEAWGGNGILTIPSNYEEYITR